MDIKYLIERTPVYRSVSYDNLDPIFIIIDISNYIIEDYYGQGENYKIIHPIGFHSRSFNSTEYNYPIYDKEILMIIDYLKK
jgi:hypothetical protein